MAINKFSPWLLILSMFLEASEKSTIILPSQGKKNKEVKVESSADQEKISLLCNAAKNNNSQEIQKLLTEPFNIDAFDPIEEWPALLLAASKNHHEIVRLLLKAGANPNICNNQDGLSALHIATQYEYEKTIIELIKHPTIDLNIQEKQAGWTPLHYAASSGNNTLVKLLICRGADPTLLSNDKKIPSEIAPEKNNLATGTFIEQLITDITKLFQIIEDAKSTDNRKIEEIKKKILQLPLIIRNYRTGNTLLHHAIKKGSLTILDYIVCIPTGAPIVSQLVTAKNKAGQTPIECAMERGSLTGNFQMLQRLIQAGKSDSPEKNKY